MEENFTYLKDNISKCQLCKKRLGFSPRPIFWGNQKSKIFQISQAPSRNVHFTGKPFNDASGKRLREWYGISETVFYNPRNFYITALAHCFPGKNKGGKGDLLPPKVCAQKWLKKELMTVDNEIYIVIGQKAAAFLFPGIPFKELVFKKQSLNKKETFILPHPSPLNRRWFKENPRFYLEKVPYIKKFIKKIIF